MKSRSTVSATKAPEGVRLFGRVKWFDPEKGFGFVTLDGGLGEAFLHHSGIRSDGDRRRARQVLPDGQKVSAFIVQDPKGPKCDDLTVEAR